VAFSPDGKYLAGGRLVRSNTENKDKKSKKKGRPEPVIELVTLTLWDAVSGEAVRTFNGQTHPVNRVLFSPNGKHLASVATGDDSHQAEVKLWDVETGKAVWALKHPIRIGVQIQHMVFSRDGKRLIVLTPKAVTFWDAATGKEVLGHTWSDSTRAVSSDGNRLVTVRDTVSDGWVPGSTVEVRDAISGEVVLTLKGHTGSVYGATFSPDGTRIATASFDRTVRLWDAVSGQEVLTLRGHGGSYFVNMAFSPDGKRLAISLGGPITIWDASKSMKEVDPQ
jgi:WD40 repeat protein